MLVNQHTEQCVVYCGWGSGGWGLRVWHAVMLSVCTYVARLHDPNNDVPRLLKLKDWPPGDDFSEKLPKRSVP